VSEALEKLRARHHRDITLEGGTVVTVRRSSMYDCILAGDIPVPVLEQMQDEGVVGDQRELLREARRRQDWTIRDAVIAIDGEPVTLTEADSLAELFSDPERREIADTALWKDAEGEA
jgi:hypothetical protein